MLKKWIKYMLLLIALIGLVAVLPMGCMVVGIHGVEEANYNLIEKKDRFEIREYTPVVAVETWVDADFEKAGNIAFRRLFNYISGNNQSKTKIDMTAPVISIKGQSEKIAMTAPVIREAGSKGWRYMFVLPASYTMEDSPKPLDENVTLVQIPERKMAVIRYSGNWKESHTQEKTALLKAWIKEKNLKPVSEPSFAGYDPPFTIPVFRRNEVMIEVE